MDSSNTSRSRPILRVKPILKTPPKPQVTFKTHQKHDSEPSPPKQLPKPPMWNAVLAHLGIFIISFYGMIRDFLQSIFPEKHRLRDSKDMKGFTNLYSSSEAFITANIFMRIRDCWNKPISSCPGRSVKVMERTQVIPNWWYKYNYTGKSFDCINMSSYNYLGFAETHGPCSDASISAVDCASYSSSSPVNELGANKYRV